MNKKDNRSELFRFQQSTIQQYNCVYFYNHVEKTDQRNLLLNSGNNYSFDKGSLI